MKLSRIIECTNEELCIEIVNELRQYTANLVLLGAQLPREVVVYIQNDTGNPKFDWMDGAIIRSYKIGKGITVESITSTTIYVPNWVRCIEINGSVNNVILEAGTEVEIVSERINTIHFLGDACVYLYNASMDSDTQELLLNYRFKEPSIVKLLKKPSNIEIIEGGNVKNALLLYDNDYKNIRNDIKCRIANYIKEAYLINDRIQVPAGKEGQFIRVNGRLMWEVNAYTIADRIIIADSSIVDEIFKFQVKWAKSWKENR